MGKQTDWQTDRQMGKQTDWQTDRQIDQQIDRWESRQIDRQIDRWESRQIDKLIDRWGKQTDWQTDRWIDRQTDIFIDEQTGGWKYWKLENRQKGGQASLYLLYCWPLQILMPFVNFLQKMKTKSCGIQIFFRVRPSKNISQSQKRVYKRPESLVCPSELILGMMNRFDCLL